MTISSGIAATIILKYETERLHIGAIARLLHIHRSAVNRVLLEAGTQRPERPPRLRRIETHTSLLDEILTRFPSASTTQLSQMIQDDGYDGCTSHLRHIVAAYRKERQPYLYANNDLIEMRRRQWLEWLFLLERDQLPPARVTDEHARNDLLERLKRAKGFDRQKILVVLAHQQLFQNETISRCLGISTSTITGYLERFRLDGASGLFRRQTRPRKADNEALRKAVFSLVHEPPSLSNINRTTWRMDDLQHVLAARGFAADKGVIRQIIKSAGYKWRKARTVLTSNDPDYREKLDKVHHILFNLKKDERFFSIDEYGPFAIKLMGGRVLSAPGTIPTIPQWQRSKGSVIMTAALELSENQLTHFFSNAKNTEEMIRMAEVLIEKYQDCRKLYLSWDAASWHISKKLNKFIDEHNSIAAYADLPQVESVPLPAGAQFLNVIESVFSGMARAIVHNSNYASRAEAIDAMNRYFMERNQHFQEHPHRAGDKIWGMERTAATFHPSNNCKDPAYR